MKVAIDCVHYPISKNLASHRASWAKYWKYHLQHMYGPDTQVDILYRGDHDKWKNYNDIYLYHGMEFNGALNLAGGVGEWHMMRFKKFADFMKNKPLSTTVLSIEHEMPDYYELLKKRKINIPELYGVTDKIIKVELPKWSEHVVIGDSHSLSAMAPLDGEFVRVFRNDFKTLNGAINEGFDKYGDLSKAKIVSFYFGNIDARHHAFRHSSSPTEAAYIYNERYYQEVKRILNNFPNIENIEIVGLLPMTSDDRKLPKSGFYEGTPFYGDIELRKEFIETFNYMMLKTCLSMGWTFFEWPDEFKTDEGTLSNEFLEKPRSVHLSQTSYRYDFENNKVRYE